MKGKRLRKTLRHEVRDCPACTSTTEFHVYESWEMPESKRSHGRKDLRLSAKCTGCGYPLINLPA